MAPKHAGDIFLRKCSDRRLGPVSGAGMIAMVFEQGAEEVKFTGDSRDRIGGGHFATATELKNLKGGMREAFAAEIAGTAFESVGGGFHSLDVALFKSNAEIVEPGGGVREEDFADFRDRAGLTRHLEFAEGIESAFIEHGDLFFCFFHAGECFGGAGESGFQLVDL